mmetsp:Transcript_21988/g.51568  ORF Transcript_21988/g.51568 Transcript_21988/m.51568 type:complete len:91 (+) Transcript_21988:415-687(+)
MTAVFAVWISEPTLLGKAGGGTGDEPNQMSEEEATCLQDTRKFVRTAIFSPQVQERKPPMNVTPPVDDGLGGDSTRGHLQRSTWSTGWYQ